jgi:N-acetylmuramoyl-L-alanine amidase
LHKKDGNEVENTMLKARWTLFGLILVCLMACTLSVRSAWCAAPMLFPDTAASLVLDPGHGGSDQGARGPSGRTEKSVCLELAQRLALRLVSRFNVRLTRSEDYDVELDQRTAVANQAKADLFISLHTGAGFFHTTQGMGVYYHHSSTPAAQTPNEGHVATEPLPWQQRQNRHTAASKALAMELQQALESLPQRPSCQVHEAPLAVLQGADMPAVLIEVGHITHPATEKFLSQSDSLDALTIAIENGIERFLANIRPQNQ